MSLLSSGALVLTDAAGHPLTFSVSGTTPPVSLSSDAGWSWFGDPRAIYNGSTSYIGSITKEGDIQIRTYTDAGVLSSPFTLHGALQVDDHDNPAIVRRLSDNRLLAFYSQHDGGTISSRLSTSPLDITAWGTEASISPLTASSSFTYPSPIQLSGEATNPIRLFYRRHFGGSGVEWDYNRSDDGGATWSAAVPLASVVYMKIGQTATRIHFACSNHPDDGLTNIWHFYLDTTSGEWRTSNGTVIPGTGAPASAFPLSTSLMTTAYDGIGSGTNAWVWDCAVDGSGNPVIVFATFPSDVDHRYQYAKWTGSAWSVHEIATGGPYFPATPAGAGQETKYSGGVVLDHSDPTIVYCSRQVSGQWEIFKYQTTDGGATFTNQALTSGSSAKNVRPVVVRGHGTALKVLWLYGTYNDYLDYDLSLMGSNV